MSVHSMIHKLHLDHLHLAGFNIYRADTKDGEYILINTDLIPAEGSPTEGASYDFIDDDVQNRKTYLYKLEDIDLNGTATEHGPVSATPIDLAAPENKQHPKIALSQVIKYRRWYPNGFL